jgi:hypothetical protein
MKELCDCGTVAVWWYMPAYEGKKEEHPFYCNDHVPRGCDCNHYSTRGEDYLPEGGNGISPTPEDQPVKWLDDHTWTRVDEQERESPCCEYMYDEKGFDIE